MLDDAGIAEIEVTGAIGVAAVACFERFGKGRHSARLNFADCLSYACAKFHGATLLFKGDDFSRTDVNAREAMIWVRRTMRCLNLSALPSTRIPPAAPSG